jgi:glucose/arabinose dehydrogenase
MRRVSAFVVVALLTAGCAGEDGRSKVAGKVERRATAETTGTAPSSTSTSTSAAGPRPTATTRPAAPIPSTAEAPSSTTSRPNPPSTRATVPRGTVEPGPTPTVPVPTPTTGRSGGLADVKLRLTKVATLDQPLALAQRAGDDTFYVAEKRGRVRAVRGGTVDDTPVLDLTSEVTTGGEQGLLGIAFSPDGSLFYASFTDRSGDSQLWEYSFRDGQADVSTQRKVFPDGIQQPYANHNGGQITFGPDELLYYGLGDGGSGNDPHDNAQNLNTLLGKMLRINPKASGDQPYTIPADNPFVGRTDARGEIWEYGLRNPWRWSFDRQTGDFWIGDVGQNTTEEVDYRPKDRAPGANFGWPYYEGTRRNPAKAAEPEPQNATPPVHEYPTQNGCAVTGGYVYRGSRIPGLRGTYLFGDFCNGAVQGLRLQDGRVAERRDLGLVAGQLASFGQDRDGELYVLSLAEGLFRIDPA